MQKLVGLQGLHTYMLNLQYKQVDWKAPKNPFGQARSTATNAKDRAFLTIQNGGRQNSGSLVTQRSRKSSSWLVATMLNIRVEPGKDRHVPHHARLRSAE